MILFSLQFKKKAANLASTVEATKNLRILQNEYIAPLIAIGLLLIGILSRKWCPVTWMRALDSGR